MLHGERPRSRRVAALRIILAVFRGFAVKEFFTELQKERVGKTDRLYKYITSETYAQRFGEAAKLTDDILELDVQEEKEHQKVWKKRGLLAVRQKNVLREIETEIAAIVEGIHGKEVQAAAAQAS